MRRCPTRGSLLLACVLALALVSCGEPPVAPVTPALRVGWFLWPGWYPMAVASQKGFFTRHGARVEPVLYESYTEMFSDFAAGRLDGVFAGLYELLKSGIPDVKVVLVTDTSDGAEGLVVAPDIATPADLKGKRIGIQGALSGSEFIITTLLRENGLERNDLVLVDVGPEIVLETMPERIQGGYTWEPFLSRARDKGYRVLFTTADTPGMVPDVVAFRGTVARERAAEVRGFVDAWFEAQDFWLRNPAEGNAAIAAVTKLDPATISLEGCRLFSRQDNQRAFTPGEDRSSLWHVGALQIAFFISIGDASTAPDLGAVLEPAFVLGREGS